MTLADVPAPRDATAVHGWLEDSSDPRRHFTTRTRTIAGTITVEVSGEQVQSGDILRRYGYVSGERELTASQLRQLAAACLDAADELDQTG
ncbi:hypothetical protein [Mycobacterium intracellulare]|uniref:hypothetical protein n=1 Tax=Mycobacterium intracellulare TaxID=1767 RepID=UPI000BAB1224|nr:hypothetical protein [Mycobacterium intracellulare]ASW95997.1 hypothetical protein CKJ67_15320 [Mycobacterium intracellulare]MCA2231128.1 hypothetical protein [Mycobacterium intracellulare]PBA22859.1 hypothetical protein CKJ68_15350 [Mycobacterium intracellulare]